MSTLVPTLREQLMTFDADKFIKTVKDLIKDGSSPTEVINALTEVLKEIGRKFENGELFLVHLVAAGDVAKRATAEVLESIPRRRCEIIPKSVCTQLSLISIDLA